MVPKSQGLDRQTSVQVLEWIRLALIDLARLRSRDA
jgi:hypothetical protein